MFRKEDTILDYYSLSDYILSITIASIVAFIGISVIRRMKFIDRSKINVHIVSFIFGAIIYIVYIVANQSGQNFNMSFMLGLLLLLFSTYAVNTAINTICYKEMPFSRLVWGSIIFALCISLVNFIDIWNEMTEKNLQMNLLLFMSANILLIGNTIATIRYIRELRKMDKVNVYWVISGSFAIGIAFASIRFTLFSSITLFSSVDLFNNHDIPIFEWFYLNYTLLPLTINVFGLVFLELFPGFVSDYHSNKQKELITKSRHSYEALFENQAVAIFTLDTKGKIIKVNKAVEEMLGYQIEELQEKALFNEVLDGYQGSVCTSYLSAAFKGESQMYETKLLTRSNNFINVQITIVPSFIEDELTSINILVKDISEVYEAREKVYHMAYHDGLTHLANRRYFKEELDRKITNANSDTRMAICFLDLDRFKLVNDIFGHQIGDHLLVEISERFKSFVDEDVLTARFGGDEFTFLFPNISSDRELENKVEEILYHISTPFVIENQELYVTASLGIAFYPSDSQVGEDLMKFADMAMYSAKSKGKNTYEFYHNYLSEKGPKQLLLEGDIRKAVKEKQFEIYYQPQVNITSGKVLGVEALLRWNHPEEGVVSPNDFISLLETNDLIGEVGAWVLAESSKQVKKWQDEGYKELRLSVNISYKQLYHQNFTHKVREMLKNTKYDPHMLDLEITESMAIKDVEYTKKVFEKIRSLGISISMDDFGTGYSSLNHLKDFPIDRLKIDGSLVRGITEDPKAKTILNTIIEMAKYLDLIVLTEQVETVEQLNYLKTINCDEVQGYLFSRPLNKSELSSFLKNNYNTSLIENV